MDLLEKGDRLNRCGLSEEPARLREFPGGGGKTGVAFTSGDGRYAFTTAGTLVAGDIADVGSSAAMVGGRWLLGGEYGGGAGTITER